MARPMLWLSWITAPLVWLLDGTSAVIFKLLRLRRESENHVTAEELHMIVAEASNAGVIEESERAIISGVVRLADRPVREVMTPRTQVEWIDLAADPRRWSPGCRRCRTAGCRSRPDRSTRSSAWSGARHRRGPGRGPRARPAGADAAGAGGDRPDGRDGRARRAARGRGADGAGP
jgi:hypothetical protein